MFITKIERIRNVFSIWKTIVYIWFDIWFRVFVINWIVWIWNLSRLNRISSTMCFFLCVRFRRKYDSSLFWTWCWLNDVRKLILSISNVIWYSMRFRILFWMFFQWFEFFVFKRFSKFWFFDFVAFCDRNF